MSILGSHRKNTGTIDAQATRPATTIPAPVNGAVTHTPVNGAADAVNGAANGTANGAAGPATVRVLGLLNQIGDRLVKSEQERIEVRSTLEELENRADMSERVFLTIQDKISKNETLESDLARRQEDLERIVRESAERLQQAEALSARIEEAIALQNRMARRLEKTAQDRAQILSKIERIEDGIEKTREALGSKALVQLAEQVAANGGWLPMANPANDRLRAEIESASPWWKRSYKMQASTAASLLAGGLLCGVAISQLIAFWPQQSAMKMPPLIKVAQSPAPATNPVAETVIANPAVTPAPATTAPEQSASEQSASVPPVTSTAPGDIAPYSDRAIETAGPESMDQIATAMNAIEPGNTTTAPAQETTAPAPAAAQSAPAPVTEPTSAAAPSKSAVTSNNEFDDTAFIAAQSDRTVALTARIQPDTALPPMVKKIEDKAFQGVPEAQHDLAAIYTAGHAGVPVDYKRAAAWFMESAAAGIANARYNLGVLYHQGLGVDKNVDKAIGWYRAAAKLGHPEAQYNLGIASIEGIGMPYDARAAATYFEQAAKGGINEADYNLGLIHENGLLGDVALNEAVYWYKLAADNTPEARMALTRVMKVLNLTDSDVDRIVREYNAIYKILPPQKAQKTGALAPAKAKQPDATELAKVIPPLSHEDSQSLLASVRRDQTMIAEVQEQLIRLHLFPGPADGIGGPQTEDAIRLYQKQNNIPMTGKPTEGLLTRLMASEGNTAANIQ